MTTVTPPSDAPAQDKPAPADTPQARAQAMTQALLANPTAIPDRFKDEQGNVNQTFLFQTLLSQEKQETAPPAGVTTDSGTTTDNTAPSVESPPPNDASEPASIAEAFEGPPIPAGANLWQLAEQQLRESGTVDDKVVAGLKAQGATDAALSAMAKGFSASKAEGMQRAYDLVGGKDAFNATVEWTKANIKDSNELAAITASLKGPGSHLVLKGLHARMLEAKAPSGQVDTSLGGGTIVPGAASLIPFDSPRSQQAAMSDPKYLSDPTYRAHCDARMMIAAGVPEPEAKKAVGLI